VRGTDTRGAGRGGRAKLTRGGKRHSRYWPRPSTARDRVLVNPLYLFIPQPGIAGPSSHRRKPPCPRLTSDIDRSASRRNARERADNSSLRASCLRINARGSGGGGEGDGANRERVAVIGLDFVDCSPLSPPSLSLSLSLSLFLSLFASRNAVFIIKLFRGARQ